MKKFQEPQVEVMKFEVEDIVTTSDPTPAMIGDCLS